MKGLVWELIFEAEIQTVGETKLFLETKVYGQKSGVEGHKHLGSREYRAVELKCNKTQKGKCFYLALSFESIFL